MPEPDPPAVALRGLHKRFGSKVAVAHVDLDIPGGSFFGIVGRNGAGKTTTLRMATGLLRPDAGEAWIHGRAVWADPVATKAVIGVLPEDLLLFDRLTGAELLTFTGLLRHMDADVVAERATQLLHVLGLDDAAGTLVVDYSHGMRKKVALAAALLHAPRVLFLDEPFEAIDPVSARAIRDVLEQFTSTGGTVVFSSHVMELVERLCDRVAILHDGRIVVTGTVDELRGPAATPLEEVFVRVVGAEVADADLSWLRSSPA